MLLRTRILLVAILPLIGFTIQSYRAQSNASKDFSLAQQMHQRLYTVTKMSELVHEMQKERGISSLFASGGGGFRASECDASRSRQSRCGIYRTLAGFKVHGDRASGD